MNILAQYNPDSGGSYHRVKLWIDMAEKLDQGHKFELTQSITEEQIKGADIVYVHWNLKDISLPQLSVWKNTYRFKLVVDIDDVWDLEYKYQYAVFKSQHLCLLADHVICSVDHIKNQIADWNTEVSVIPNLLPYNELQFTPKPKRNGKLRIGIGGSISHCEDYLSLHGIIKHLEKQRWFTDNCEFAIIGYDNTDDRWRRVASMFKQVKLFKFKDVENYMSLYDELDIMLLPLLDTTLNRGRSNLKIHECCVKGVIPIIGNLYLEKGEFNSKLLKENWIQNIKNLVEDKTLLHTISTWNTFEEKQTAYYNVCVHERLNLFTKIIEYLPRYIGTHYLRSIIYKDGQQTEYPEYRNRINIIADKSYLFEYNPIIDIVDQFAASGYIGIFSPKFPFKTGYYKKYVQKILDHEDADVVIFCQQRTDYLVWTEQQHPGFLAAFLLVCKRLGLRVHNNIPTVYSNFFVAKAHVYKQYTRVLQQAIDIMEEPEIRGIFWQDANYVSGLNQKDLQEATGLDHYTFHTFILERLMSVWLANKEELTYSIYE